MPDAGLFDDAANVAAGELAAINKRVLHLLMQIADVGTCKGCPATIYWVRHKNGVRTPYDADGTNHFVTCPSRDRFKRR